VPRDTVIPMTTSLPETLSTVLDSLSRLLLQEEMVVFDDFIKNRAYQHRSQPPKAVSPTMTIPTRDRVGSQDIQGMPTIPEGPPVDHMELDHPLDPQLPSTHKTLLPSMLDTAAGANLLISEEGAKDVSYSQLTSQSLPRTTMHPSSPAQQMSPSAFRGTLGASPNSKAQTALQQEMERLGVVNFQSPRPGHPCPVHQPLASGSPSPVHFPLQVQPIVSLPAHEPSSDLDFLLESPPRQHPIQGPGSLVPTPVMPWTDPDQDMEAPSGSPGPPELTDDVLSMENVLELGLLEPGPSRESVGHKPPRYARRLGLEPTPTLAGRQHHIPPSPIPPDLPFHHT